LMLGHDIWGCSTQCNAFDVYLLGCNSRV
jgi:hypothetical protein